MILSCKPFISFLAWNINWKGSAKLAHAPPNTCNLAAISTAPSGLSNPSAILAAPSSSKLNLAACTAISVASLTPFLKRYVWANLNDLVKFLVAFAELTPILRAAFNVSSMKSLVASALILNLSIWVVSSIAPSLPNTVPSDNAAIAIAPSSVNRVALPIPSLNPACNSAKSLTLAPIMLVVIAAVVKVFLNSLVCLPMIPTLSSVFLSAFNCSS